MASAGTLPVYKVSQILHPYLEKAGQLRRAVPLIAAAEIAVEAGTIMNEYKCNQFKIDQTAKCNQLK